jgi:hypothetical protein
MGSHETPGPHLSDKLHLQFFSSSSPYLVFGDHLVPHCARQVLAPSSCQKDQKAEMEGRPLN